MKTKLTYSARLRKCVWSHVHPSVCPIVICPPTSMLTYACVSVCCITSRFPWLLVVLQMWLKEVKIGFSISCIVSETWSVSVFHPQGCILSRFEVYTVELLKIKVFLVMMLCRFEGTIIIEMWRTCHPVTWCCIPEDLNLDTLCDTLSF